MVLSNERTPLLNDGVDGQPEHEESTFWGDNDPQPWRKHAKRGLHVTLLLMTSSYVNILLIFVPLGIIAGALKWNASVVFVLNFLAIIPLAALLGFTTEELSAESGQTIGGLLNATFGNAVELIVSIVALLQGQIRIVQASMLGSILSNILLVSAKLALGMTSISDKLQVLGCCFIAAGIKGGEQKFNATGAGTMSSLMAVASASLIIPATLYATISNAHGKGSEADRNTLILSHGTAIILLVLYILYLFFQLKTHKNLFDEETQNEEEDRKTRILSPVPAGIAMVVITIIVAVCAEYLVDSIDAIVETTHISKTFIGLILLPIVGNAAEHVTACLVAYKKKMDLAIGVALGSSLQIALFVTPFLVILGWIVGQPMTLYFQGFETVVFFISMLVVNYLIQDGASNYLEGAMCLGT